MFSGRDALTLVSVRPVNYPFTEGDAHKAPIDVGIVNFELRTSVHKRVRSSIARKSESKQKESWVTRIWARWETVSLVHVISQATGH